MAMTAPMFGNNPYHSHGISVHGWRFSTERTSGFGVGYAVKEIFLTLQGEGAQVGRRAVFCRFAGCNLWSGREADRSTAQCRFCDTDFVGTDGTRGGSFPSAAGLANVMQDEWGENGSHRFVVLTGGEPLLQADNVLLDTLHDRGFTVAVETN